MKKWSVLYFAILFSLMGLLAGCNTSNESKSDEHHTENEEASSHESHGSHEDMASGDIQETTNSVDEIPSFLKDKDENMKAIYIAAAKHPEVLKYMPCYCGCGDSVGHKSNLNCFVHEIDQDKVVWDDHGTRCGVCLEIAAQSVLMYNDGKSLKDIRQQIDQQYKEGYAKPTPTPMPS
ncbi:hypothetical protein J2S13_000827 [Oikeobacillus pervagus]|uniref:Lipoprotein n=1 Tax=Oikeobacillus pervagus TaxID=1325931 RepID=A0AAJ1T368_9BACI|nr:PCYCGC motif-containing (lipo)protein [Oikeobacillus pervagus]MDQ0214431.1 hypothetical protein [Oikeobacillus pervagus]